MVTDLNAHGAFLEGAAQADIGAWGSSCSYAQARVLCSSQVSRSGMARPSVVLKFTRNLLISSETLHFEHLNLWRSYLSTCPETPSGSASLSYSRSLTKGPSQGWRFSSAVKSPDFCSLEQLFSVSVTSWPRRFGRWQASHFAICPSIWVCLYFLMIKLWLLIWRQSPTEVMVSSHFGIFDGIR